MRLPQPRIRTLMIAVAVAAGACWLLLNAPGIGLIVMGPLVGPVAMGRVVRDPVGVHLGGALAGGASQTLVLFGVVELGGVLGGRWDLYAGFLMCSMFAGFVIGLGSLSIHVLRTALAQPARLAHGPAEEAGIWFLDDELTSPRLDEGPAERAAPARPVR